MSHRELVDIAYKWVIGSAGCGVAFRELKTTSWETPDVIGFGGKVTSLLIECKTSRADFLADKRKPFRMNPSLGMGTHRVYCCREGLIKLHELPEKWALLSVKENGRLKLTFRPDPQKPEAHFLTHLFAQESSDRAEWGVMYSALRRLHLRGHIDSIYEKFDPRNP